MATIINARVIRAGAVTGDALVTNEAIGFFGHVSPETSEILEPGHPLQGQRIAGKILVFPHAKGSTVGSYTLYALSRRGLAPAAMILGECETIVAVGAIIGDIPTFDGVDISLFSTGDHVKIENGRIRIEARP